MHVRHIVCGVPLTLLSVDLSQNCYRRFTYLHCRVLLSSSAFVCVRVCVCGSSVISSWLRFRQGWQNVAVHNILYHYLDEYTFLFSLSMLYVPWMSYLRWHYACAFVNAISWGFGGWKEGRAFLRKSVFLFRRETCGVHGCVRSLVAAANNLLFCQRR